MAQDLPYSVVCGKLSDLFKKIGDAKVPDSFSHAFLRDTLGFKSSNDRTLYGTVRALGLIDSSGRPTPRYRELKNDATKKNAIAAGILEAYAPLFKANEKAYELPAEELKGLIAQVAGTDKDMTQRIFYTLNALIKEADFSRTSEDSGDEDQDEEDVEESQDLRPSRKRGRDGVLNPAFHFNIQVHLPNNGTEETYLNIFNALREAFR